MVSPRDCAESLHLSLLTERAQVGMQTPHLAYTDSQMASKQVAATLPAHRE